MSPVTSTEELVRLLRRAEYGRRVQEMRGERQEIAKSEHRNDSPHVVYVMAHVGVTGGARVIFEHANRLHAMGMRITIVCHYPKPFWHHVDCEYIQVPFHVELAQGIPPCDVIVATYWDHIDACVRTGLAPVVYFEQGDFHLFEEVQPALFEVIRNGIRSAARVTACSPSVAGIIRDRYDREVAQVFLNAVDHRTFYPSHEPKPGPSGTQYLLVIGSDQAAFKGVRDVLQAYYAVKRSHRDLELVWVSPSPVTQPVGRVYVSPDQPTLARLYRNAAVYVSGSYYEAFSLPPLEAMACGCPVVTTANEGVLTYAVDGVNCLLARIGDPESLALQITRLLEDQGLALAIRQGGLETAARFQWTATVSELRHFYEDLSSCRVVQRNDLSSWNVCDQSSLTPSGQEQLERLLSWTDSDVVLAPFVFEAFEGHKMARWLPVATRRNGQTRRAERLWVPIAGLHDGLPYSKAWRQFIHGKYGEALALFQEHFRAATDGTEQAVYVRWIVLCLVELERDREAVSILENALTLHPTNTDLIYLYGLLMRLQGHREEAAQRLSQVCVLGESASYPEFFWGIAELAKEHQP